MKLKKYKNYYEKHKGKFIQEYIEFVNDYNIC